MVSMILLRALHKDISRYNAVDAQVNKIVTHVGWILTVYIGGCTRGLWMETCSW